MATSLQGALQKYNGIIDRNNNAAYAANEIGYIKTLDAGLQGKFPDMPYLSPQTPMSIRGEIIAQQHYRASLIGVDTTQSIRVANLFHATLGFVLTLVARIIRVVLRTIFLPLSLAVAAYQQSKYGTHLKVEGHHIVKEDAVRVCYEWIDLAATMLVPFIGLMNTVYPNMINLKGLKNYYISRIDRVFEKDADFVQARDKYNAQKAASYKQWAKTNASELPKVG